MVCAAETILRGRRAGDRYTGVSRGGEHPSAGETYDSLGVGPRSKQSQPPSVFAGRRADFGRGGADGRLRPAGGGARRADDSTRRRTGSDKCDASWKFGGAQEG